MAIFFFVSITFLVPQEIPVASCAWYLLFSKTLDKAGRLKTGNIYAYFDISVEQQFLRTQADIFVLEFMAGEQFGGSVIKLEVVTSNELLLLCKETGWISQKGDAQICQLQLEKCGYLLFPILGLILLA